MKIKASFILAALLFLFFSLNSCSVSRDQEVEGDVNAFRAWVNMQAHEVAERREQDWQRVLEEFSRRRAALDSRQDQLPDNLQAEYEQLKEEFGTLDRERRHTLAHRAEVAAWEQRLLGSFAAKATITRENIQLVYSTFMEKVRATYNEWSDTDWEMAKEVLGLLDQRKAQVADELPSEEEVQIKALQMEFAALETSARASIQTMIFPSLASP